MFPKDFGLMEVKWGEEINKTHTAQARVELELTGDSDFLEFGFTKEENEFTDTVVGSNIEGLK